MSQQRADEHLAKILAETKPHCGEGTTLMILLPEDWGIPNPEPVVWSHSGWRNFVKADPASE